MLLGVDLSRVKQGLGINAADTTRDVQIELMADVALAQMRSYTGATLSPMHLYRDIFHNTYFGHGMLEGLTPRHHPVQGIESISINGAAVDPTLYNVTTDGRISTFNNSAAACGEVDLVYVAGFPILPPDLESVFLFILSQILATPFGFQVINKVSLVDVGTIETKMAQSFAELLGPFGAVLDRYHMGAAVVGPLAVESYDLGVFTPPALLSTAQHESTPPQPIATPGGFMTQQVFDLEPGRRVIVEKLPMGTAVYLEWFDANGTITRRDVMHSIEEALQSKGSADLNPTT